MKTPNEPRLAATANYLSATRRFVPALLTMLAGAMVGRGADVKFDVNDVSFLWPVATTATEVDQLISMEDPAADGPIWPRDVFDDVVAKAQSEATKVKGGGDGVGISFPDELKNPHNWKVVGIRVNPASLGADEKILTERGQVPGIRLVVQPVTVVGGKVKVHDFAAHLAFNFIQPPANLQNPFPFKPDDDAFKPVVLEDLVQLKQMVEKSTSKPTTGKLGVHPGFTANVPGFRDRIRKMLKDRVGRKRLQVISFMGIAAPDPEPWVFFSVMQFPDGKFNFRSIGSFPTPNPSASPPVPPTIAQMITLQGGPVIAPQPKADPASGNGLSMALLFADDVKEKLDKPLFSSASTEPFKSMLLQDLPDLIGNPKFRNTLNTDCISCHTDTTRKIDLGINGVSKVAFDISALGGISGVDLNLLPKGGKNGFPSWNVRNFGWFPDFFPPSKTVVTVSMRAANEAAESADFINRTYLK